MPLDLALVVVDIVLLVSENGDVALLRALRLLRTAKFRSAPQLHLQRRRAPKGLKAEAI